MYVLCSYVFSDEMFYIHVTTFEGRDQEVTKLFAELAFIDDYSKSATAALPLSMKHTALFLSNRKRRYRRFMDWVGTCVFVCIFAAVINKAMPYICEHAVQKTFGS